MSKATTIPGRIYRREWTEFERQPDGKLKRRNKTARFMAEYDSFHSDGYPVTVGRYVDRKGNPSGPLAEVATVMLLDL